MEKCKKVVYEVKKVGEPDQYGNNAYSIKFADNTSGFFKCKDQDLFFEGKEAEFYVELTTGRTGKEYSKIHRVSSVENEFNNNEKKPSTSEPGSGKSKETSDMINRSVAIKAICELRAGGKYTAEQVIEEAEILFDYIQFGVTENVKVTPVTKAEEDDDLPF